MSDEVQLTNEQKAKRVAKWLRVINIVTALFVIAFSVLSGVFIITDAVLGLKFFLIFSPVFMAMFGVFLLAAEFKIRFIMKKVPFLKSNLGKGLFYLFLSSIVYYYFMVGGQATIAWASAITLFASSIIYLAVHFGCAASVKQETEDEYEPTYKERLV